MILLNWRASKPYWSTFLDMTALLQWIQYNTKVLQGGVSLCTHNSLLKQGHGPEQKLTNTHKEQDDTKDSDGDSPVDIQSL